MESEQKDDEYVFTLEKKARKNGGDKYVCESDSDFNIYFPQSISRVNGVAKDTIIVYISRQE